MDPRSLDDLAKQLAAAVPESLSTLKRDLEANFKAVLQAALTKMNLVTRQEFDVQVAVLRRTREKLDALEARLATLAGEEMRRPAVGQPPLASESEPRYPAD